MKQSDDRLVTDMVRDLLRRLPLTVEKEERASPQSTLKGIMASPIWESLCANRSGKRGLGCLPFPQPPGEASEAHSRWRAKLECLSSSWEDEEEQRGWFCRVRGTWTAWGC